MLKDVVTIPLILTIVKPAISHRVTFQESKTGQIP